MLQNSPNMYCAGAIAMPDTDSRIYLFSFRSIYFAKLFQLLHVALHYNAVYNYYCLVLSLTGIEDCRTSSQPKTVGTYQTSPGNRR
jgi:hypothetical protein